MGFFNNIGSTPIQTLISLIDGEKQVYSPDLNCTFLTVDTTRVKDKWAVTRIAWDKEDGFLMDPKIVLWWFNKEHIPITDITKIRFTLNGSIWDAVNWQTHNDYHMMVWRSDGTIYTPMIDDINKEYKRWYYHNYNIPFLTHGHWDRNNYKNKGKR